ncbi:delta-1-pyrroline-5-carboxylate dehydrogenase [Niveomyces insectorum RCEF 264]|uniref:L-glutamate gamma-semialdehyde dehydrogenase n=1 Tax=Niveomyces insectorum RCEF 264 TaxID=1081102 RepID=A0A167U6B7_9HYPO|nr:delta-1-pyrroline-5-carboxylate dehydrogenase [Niveomyces insectorum RCEF 264]
MATRRLSRASNLRPLCTAAPRRVQQHHLLSEPCLSGRARPQIRMSSMAAFKPPSVANEPNHTYAKGSAQRAGLTAAIDALQAQGPLDVPLMVGGKEVRTASTGQQRNPANHRSVVATYAQAGDAEVRAAIESALAAQADWAATPFADRAAIFLKAADLISTKYRYPLMAATMLGQGKNAWQAEIDAAAELCDFLRFNVHYAEQLYAQQPQHHARGVWNRTEYRPLEGFVYAVSPFNFTAIGGNLVAAPALLGNVVVWKPSDSAVASNWLLYRILLEAGLPPNVIQFVPGPAPAVTKTVLDHPHFAGLHFTGSTAVFRQLWGAIGAGTAAGRYGSYPRVVGETGGKNFHLVHASADVDNAVVQTVRGAFEYQGQKCSATSRVYVPASLWPRFRDRLVAETAALSMGPPTEPQHFVGPVIHEAAFQRLAAVQQAAALDAGLELLVGGGNDGTTGYYVQPTIYATRDPAHPLLARELFGPVLVACVYDDKDGSLDAFADACDVVNGTSPYGLTGTGAVVGQQAFGGGRASGTNDKAGSPALLQRFVSVRSIKEEFGATTTVGYPSNEV